MPKQTPTLPKTHFKVVIPDGWGHIIKGNVLFILPQDAVTRKAREELGTFDWSGSGIGDFSVSVVNSTSLNLADVSTELYLQRTNLPFEDLDITDRKTYSVSYFYWTDGLGDIETYLALMDRSGQNACVVEVQYAAIASVETTIPHDKVRELAYGILNSISDGVEEPAN